MIKKERELERWDHSVNSPDDGTHVLQLALREITTLARMNHQNVVSLLGLVRENPSPESPQCRRFGLVFPYIEHDLLSYMLGSSAEAYHIVSVTTCK